MPNTENLVSLADRTTDEQREIAKKGGIASGEARREKKLIATALRSALMGTIEGSDTTVLDAWVKNALANEFAKGDISGLVNATRILGELTDKHEVTTTDVTGIRLVKVDKTKRTKRGRKERDPKIVGEFTEPQE